MPASSTRSRKKNIPLETILIDECQVEHSKCPIRYYKRNGMSTEYCMCQCHPHATRAPPEEEPRVGIGVIE